MKFFLVAGLVAMAAAGPIGYGKPSEEQSNSPSKPSPVHNGAEGGVRTQNPAQGGSSGKKDGTSPVDGITKSSPQLGDAGKKATDSVLGLPGFDKSGKDSHDTLINAPVTSNLNEGSVGDSNNVSSGKQGSGAGQAGGDVSKSSPVSTGSGDDKTGSLVNLPVKGNGNSAVVGSGNAMLGGSASGSAQGNSGAGVSSPSEGATKDNSGSPLVNLPIENNLNDASAMSNNAVGTGVAAKGDSGARGNSPSSSNPSTDSDKTGTLVNLPITGNGNSASMLNGNSMLGGDASKSSSGSVSSPAKGASNNDSENTTGTLIEAPIAGNANGASLMNGNSILGGDASGKASKGATVSNPSNSGASKDNSGSQKTGTLINMPIENNGNSAGLLNGNAVSSPVGGQSGKGINGLFGGSGDANGGVCSGNYIAQCCQLDVEGIVALTCHAPTSGLTSSKALNSDCAATGTTAQCCLLPVAGQALVCHDV